MRVGLWSRWFALNGVPRAFLAIQARRGDPMAQVLANHGRSQDPYPFLEQIRARGPLVRTRFTWATVDHGVCRDILRDRRFGVTDPTRMELPGPLRALIAHSDPGVANPVEPPAMVVADPPDHTRYRQSVSQSFTPRAIDRLSTRVLEVTTELIHRLAKSPRPDLIADFATRLPVEIIAEILDLPAQTHTDLLDWGHHGAPLLDIGIPWKTYRDAIDSLAGAERTLRQRFDQVRAGDPGDNAFTRLAADHSLTAREFTSNAALLIGAGFETTVNLIGNGIVLLLQNPEQLNRLRAEPELWPAAIEEILRVDSPVQMTARTAGCEMEIAGRRIAKGDMVALFLGGANRDPEVFPDPTRFDVGRPNARDHLAFASGIHACLGAALARVEGVTALRALFEAFPDLHLAAPPQRRGLVNLRGYSSLPAHVGGRKTAGHNPSEPGVGHLQGGAVQAGQ
ncbi:cytochrome P450 [Mycobacterium sp. BMJ-28]